VPRGHYKKGGSGNGDWAVGVRSEFRTGEGRGGGEGGSGVVFAVFFTVGTVPVIG